MAGDRSPQRPRGDDESAGAGQGWTAISYLIGGILVWGGAGWLVDRWLQSGGVATAVGAVLGAAGGVYLIVRRLGA
jgi:F0F1-type ATP synthase assembly protein I